jgi:putative acetyltransferase
MLLLRPLVAGEAELADVRHVINTAFEDSDTSTLVDLIRKRGNARMETIAIERGQIVGHILLSPLQFAPEQTQLKCLAIAPVSVLPERQGEGIGAALMQHVIQLARSQGIDALFLLGHVSYYPRFGFVPATIGNEYGATDAFMSLELRSGCLDQVKATALYVPEFAEVGV